MYVHGIQSLFQFPGYVVEKIRIDRTIAEVKLRWDRRRCVRCSQCGGKMSVSRTVEQVARDLGLGTVSLVLLRYPAIQGRCRHCRSYETIRPPGIEPRRQATWRLMRYVSQLCRYMPIKSVGEVLPLRDTVIRRWDRAVLQETLPEPDLDDLKVLLVDEKSVGRHHQFVTLVMNGVSGELLHMAEGKKKQSLESFFARLTPEQKQRIEAVGMDRSGAYHAVVNEQIPHADVVYDKFHLIQNYNEVIDTVRRTEWRKAKAEQKSVIKGQRYILLKNPENRTTEDNQRLAELISVNHNIALVDMLKDDLRGLWSYRYRAWAERWLKRWTDWAINSGIQALQRFGRSLLNAKDHVLNYCKHPITTGRLEGFNNIISRVVHRACGAHDMRYLFLKLRQESLY